MAVAIKHSYFKDKRRDSGERPALTLSNENEKIKSLSRDEQEKRHSAVGLLV